MTDPSFLSLVFHGLSVLLWGLMILGMLQDKRLSNKRYGLGDAVVFGMFFLSLITLP